MCGLAAATMLADAGHVVTVLERDPAPPPLDPAGAFDWDRKSVAQFGLGHWMHSRGTAIFRERLPRAYELLVDNGGYHFNLVKYLLSMQPEAIVEPEDDRFDLLTGRRSTLEWSLSTAADEHPGITVRRGEAIAGFLTEGQPAGGVPHIKGLRLKTGEEITADLVIDAMGRRSQTPEWLNAIGATSPAEEGEESGFAYYGRYLRSPDGSMPHIMGPLLAPYGSFSILSLPADNNTWSLTLYGLADDKPLRRFRDADVFERVVRACPLHEHWLAGEPMTEMKSMAGGVDRHREFVVDGVPCATGVLIVGDANACTNPSLGRGMTLGLMHVEVMVECIAEHLADPLALSLAFHERGEAVIGPWHDATTATDRRRVSDMKIYRDGGVPKPTSKEQIADLIGAAASTDAVAARVYGDVMGCMALPDEVLARAGVFDHIVGLADHITPEPLPGPDRDQLLELVS